MVATGASAGSALDRIMKKGELAVGTSGTQPPMSATNKKGELMGMGVDLLLKSKIDVIVADYQFCALTAYRHQKKGLIAGASPLTFEPLGIAMPEDALLLNWVQNFFNQFHGTGEMKKLSEKWLNPGSWVDDLP
jgi:ABC-type amino acid transport substrate-binding protein